MKKITQIAETGGARIDFDDFRDVFNKEIWDVLQGVFSAYDSDAQGVIISGCIVGGTGPSSYTLSSGIVYIDGEFRRVSSASSLSLPQYIKAATDINITRTFQDSNIKTLYITKSADLATSAPGAGQYIAITTTTDPDKRRYGRPLFSTSSTNLRKKVSLQIGDWNMDSSSSVLVPHGLGSKFNTIRVESVMIINDAASEIYPLTTSINNLLSGDIPGNCTNVDGTNIGLNRLTGSFFDSTNFDATSYNRGWIDFTYEP